MFRLHNREDIKFVQIFPLFIILILLSSITVYAERVWREKDGVVIIETESVDSALNPEKWELANSPQGYTGSGYLVWKSWGNMYKNPLMHDAITDPDNTLKYKVWIDSPGEYAIHIRNLHHEEDGDNDVWVSINQSPYDKVWDHHIDQFTWTDFDLTTWELNPGINEITIAGRSKGMGIDRIALHKPDLPQPLWSDINLSESPLVILDLSPDYTAPTPPKNLRIVDTKISSIELSWFPAQDAREVMEYEIYANNHLMGTTFVNSFAVSGLNENYHYSISVKAKDVSGNVSLHSDSVDTITESFNPDQDIYIKYIKESPVIDGEFDDMWHRQVQYPVEHIIDGSVNTKEDLYGHFRAAWDDNYLYVIAEVHDDVQFPELKPETKPWETDGVRLYLDPDHSQSPLYSMKDRRYRFIGNKTKIQENIQRDAYIKGVESALGGPPPAKRSWHEKPDGYFVEMAYPWNTLGVQPYDGKLIGLDIIYQDNDDGQTIDGRIAWFGKDNNAGNSPYHLGTAKLVKGIVSGSEDDYLPEEIWIEENGIAVAEAEAIDHHTNWEFKTDPQGYTGEGYLIWNGPNRTLTPDGRGGNDDYTNERQGPQDEWLIVRVLVSNPGIYHVNARNIHEKEDGDNDAWVWKAGKPITDWNPVRRMGDSLKDSKGFTWLDWGVRSFWLKAGINNIYIAGRSIGFGLDRIVLYQANNDKAKQKALNLQTPISTLANK